MEASGFDCNNTSEGAIFNEACWQRLDLTNYLTTWSLPTCPADGSLEGEGCCQAGEAWSTCFLRWAQNDATLDCTQINVGSCHFEKELNPALDRDLATKAKARYVGRTIVRTCLPLCEPLGGLRKCLIRVEINMFFVNWWLALMAGTTQAGLQIGAIITKINPPKPTNVALSDILSAFTAGLAFASLPIVFNEISKTAQAFVTGIQQAPGVGKAIWPVGTVGVGHSHARTSSQFMGCGLNNVHRPT